MLAMYLANQGTSSFWIGSFTNTDRPLQVLQLRQGNYVGSLLQETGMLVPSGAERQRPKPQASSSIAQDCT